jgi:hypothetical protein
MADDAGGPSGETPAPDPSPEPAPQPAPEPTPEADAAEPEAAPERRISGSIYAAVAANYVFRGITQEAAGPVFQPGASFSVSLVQLEKGLTDLSLGVGIWNSLQRPVSASDRNVHYELDFTASLSATFADTVNTALTYALYSSPRHSFTPVHELIVNVNAGLAPDDVVTLTPGLTFVAELRGQGDGGEREGLYLEPAFALDFALPVPNWEPSISVPMLVGLSLRDYYEGANGSSPFGFFSVRGTANLPLSFIPEPFGAWSIAVGGGVALLGPTCQELYGGVAAPIADFTIGVEF